MNKAINGITKGTDTAIIVRLAIFAAFSLVAGILAYVPLKDLLTNAERSEYYSHILLIPFVTAYFLFEVRKAVREEAKYRPGVGAVLTVAGIVVCLIALRLQSPLGLNDFASVATAGCVVLWWGGFVLAFGGRSFRVARFPLLFMIFMVPIPEFLLDRLIYVLQVGSTEVTQWLFELTGTNYIRDGFVYQLTGINIEVAKECSSIRSSIALIITGVVAGHLFLRSGWKVLILLVAMLPINIIKNGIRIVTLSLLAIYVDRKFITDSFLHHSGGFLFYLPALGMMALMIMWLRKGEAKKKKEKKEDAEKGETNLPQMGTDERR
jgi:exosortase